MAQFDTERTRILLQNFNFQELFVECLGWSYPISDWHETITIDNTIYTYWPIAKLSDYLILEVVSETGDIPGSNTREKVYRQIAKNYHENVLIFVDSSEESKRSRTVWYWMKREGGKRFTRSHPYIAGQAGELMLGKISAMFVDMSELDEDGNIDITEVAFRVRDALDVEHVTRKFYDEFQRAHQVFLESITGIDDESDRHWYASVILNRLMFIYFLQKKGFLDPDAPPRHKLFYLQRKLEESRARGTDLFYKQFLTLLFFEGFARTPATRSLDVLSKPLADQLCRSLGLSECPEEEQQQSDVLKQVLGQIPFLNGGLFLRHRIEREYGISIPDESFQTLFEVFSAYTWNLEDAPAGRANEINPDVLGFIFEQYINELTQKEMGAFYTRPEITEYLCEQTIHRRILQEVNDVITHDVGEPQTPTVESVEEMLLHLEGDIARLLLNDILPSLTVLDPACGSGAFLVAAMKTLRNIYEGVLGRIPFLTDTALKQKHDAIVTQHPNLNYYVKKEIIINNLYGVDIMHEAVEIARLRLFLALVASAQAPSDLEPLPNIDFNIMAGNSLLGLLRVEEDAYQKYRQPGLFSGPVRRYTDIVSEKSAMVRQYRNAADRPDMRNNPEAVGALRARIQEHRRKNAEVLNQLLLDEFQQLNIKYEQATWDDARRRQGKAVKRALTISDIEELEPFHWGYEFAEVMNEKGGFDVIIANPPWEVFQTYEKEFFQQYDSIQKKKLRIEDWKKQRSKLMAEPDIRHDWLSYVSRFPHQWNYFKNIEQYRHQTSRVEGRRVGNKLNLYALFTEQIFNLLKEGGKAGAVLPSGIYTDLGTKGLRQLLIEYTEITGVFGFENRKNIFEGPDSRLKFVVLTFEKGEQTNAFPATFMRHDVDELAVFPKQGAYHITTDLVRRTSPASLSIPEIKSEEDLTITRKLQALPLLSDEVNGWGLEIYGEELNMTRASHYFYNEPTEHPLYEGSMIWHYDAYFASPRYWIKPEELRDAFLKKRVSRVKGLKEVPSDMRNDYEVYRLAYRRIASNTNERTLIATVIPPYVFAGHSLGVNFPHYHDRKRYNSFRLSYQELLVLTSILNSFVTDFLLRMRMTTNLSTFYLNQLPVPRISEDDPLFPALLTRAAKLICTTSDYDNLARHANLKDHTEGVTDPAERAELQAELDGLVAHLYSLTEKEFQHVLSAFSLVETSVKEAALAAYNHFAPDPELLAMIGEGENINVEFKVGAFLNPHTGQRDNKMVKSVVEAVAAFLNSYDGGTLLIGVDDDGIIYGVDREYVVVNQQKANRDGYELGLRDVLDHRIGAAFSPYYTITFVTIQGHDLCQIQVRPSNEPAYLDGRLYVRAGNRSPELATQDAIDYINERWQG